MAHGREAKMLCKKIVNFFSLLSHTQESGVRRLGMTQELLSLVTGLAHYLKILIRIALTCALKLVSAFGSTLVVCVVNVWKHMTNAIFSTRTSLFFFLYLSTLKTRLAPLFHWIYNMTT